MDNALALLVSVLGIVVIDLVLSGDNAVVIGMAARRLSPHQRRRAIVLGGAAAIVLRITFAAIATLLLRVPLLQAAGGGLLLWIAWRLLREEQEEHELHESRSMLGALRTIVLADVVMSLDNILAVAGASHGSLELLAFGLVLSMPLLLFGSSMVARIMNRMPWLALVGAAILTWTAGGMIAEDEFLLSYLPYDHAIELLLPGLFTIGLVGPSFLQLPSVARVLDPLLERMLRVAPLAPVVATMRRVGGKRIER
ncbi:MAG TPA: TerC family protein [Chloroflexota bacterium]|nr:TerC family protein [Chloroflexota bacterium]HEX2986732.1 TerC family protein [Chloroflexota bacterium]